MSNLDDDMMRWLAEARELVALQEELNDAYYRGFRDGNYKGWDTGYEEGFQEGRAFGGGA